MDACKDNKRLAGRHLRTLVVAPISCGCTRTEVDRSDKVVFPVSLHSVEEGSIGRRHIDRGAVEGHAAMRKWGLSGSVPDGQELGFWTVRPEKLGKCGGAIIRVLHL
jgi:hypothetical protein